MNQKRNPHYEALGFYTIIEKCQSYTVSQGAKDAFEKLVPYKDEKILKRKMQESKESKQMIETLGAPPLSGMKGITEILTLSENGGMLLPDQLMTVAAFTASSKRMVSYLMRGEDISPMISSYGRSFGDLAFIQEEIHRCIQGEQVTDDASNELRNIRRKKDFLEGQIKEKLAHILQSRKEMLADSYITTRGDRYVLPVKRQYQNQFGGTVVEVSGKGGTVFMEPKTISKLQEERTLLLLDEDSEIRRILYILSALIATHAKDFHRNIEGMEQLDFLFAKGKLGIALKGEEVTIGLARTIHIKDGRHPLLPEEHCVPLNFTLTTEHNGVIITGPNTGGKTVALKTIGLLSLMAQCGLLVPCKAGSTLAMMDDYFVDIGDSQSISQNLSTFSGHMTNIINMLSRINHHTMVILDELGSGTDPLEGMGIAIAILEELHRLHCTYLVTTHYPQVKTYAEETMGVVSARMAFDPETLSPLYRLELGKSGESCALQIAQGLGLSSTLLSRAHMVVYGEEKQFSSPTLTKNTSPKSRLIGIPHTDSQDAIAIKFTMGDSVVVLSTGELGIVYCGADEKGDVIVQVKGKKQKIKHNRLQLKVSAADLYPPDYDFSIIFDTVDNRKSRHQMDKRHRPDLIIIHQ